MTERLVARPPPQAARVQGLALEVVGEACTYVGLAAPTPPRRTVTGRRGEPAEVTSEAVDRDGPGVEGAAEDGDARALEVRRVEEAAVSATELPPLELFSTVNVTGRAVLVVAARPILAVRLLPSEAPLTPGGPPCPTLSRRRGAAGTPREEVSRVTT